MSLKQIWIETGEDYSNSKKKYSYGYNEELDAIIISKDGTLGKVVVIDELRIGLPSMPNHASKILNGQVKDPKNQKWKRQEIPNELSDIESYEEYQTYPNEFTTKWDKYIDREFDRRKNGIWIMINGEAEYMPPQCYMFVQWNSLGGNRYPKYRYAQRVLWTHWAACVADDRCLGQCYLKNRRSGYSTMNSSDDGDFATSNEWVNVGIMSKSGKDAQKMFTGMIVPAIQRYPFFFMPLTEGSNAPKTKYVFKEPAQKIGKENKIIKAGGGLNSEIEWWNTGLNAMDGMHIEKMSLDEIGKFPPDVPFDEYWQIAQECLTEGGDITGKCMAGSTANASKKGGDQFKDIYHASKIHTRNEDTERTESGMYSLFIPAEYNLSRFMDEFGHPILYDNPNGIVNEKGKIVKKGSISFLKAQREALKHKPEKLNEALRKHPTTESHAFRNPSNNSIFNISKIYEQNDNNASLKTRKVVRGDFKWKIKDKEVIWIPHVNGKMLMRWMPDKKDRNKSITHNNRIVPVNQQSIVAGIDSYDIKATVDGRGSNGSMHVYVKHGFDNEVNNEFVCEYVDRPATAEQFFENCLMIAFFYGAMTLIENNKPRILYHWKERGYRGYSANRWDKPYRKLSPTERELGGIPNTSNAIKLWHAESIATYIQDYIGVNTSDDPDLMGHMGSCHFDELLMDWEGFDIDDRTQYDRSISSGLCLMLANKRVKSEVIRPDATENFEYVRNYNNPN